MAISIEKVSVRLPVLYRRYQSILHSKLNPIARKSAWAVADQGIFAVSNFVVNIFLARELVPSEYGAYVTAMTILLLIGAVHTALITEPMLVFGPGKSPSHLRIYLSTLVVSHVLFSLVSIGLVLLISTMGSVIPGWMEVGPLIVMVSLTSGFILFAWLMRRVCYLELRPQLSAKGGTLYAIIIVVGLCILYYFQWLSPKSAIFVTSIASLISGLWIAFQLGIWFGPDDGALTVYNIIQRHWAFGRWAVASRAIGWLPENLWYWILPIWGDLDGNGAFRAVMNLNLPLLHTISVSSLLLTPILVRTRGTAKFMRIVFAAILLFSALSVIYWLILAYYQQAIIVWLYDNKYYDYAHLFLTIGSYPVIIGIGTVLTSALRALEKPDKILKSYLFSAGLTIPVGIYLSAVWGVSGAAVGLMLSSMGAFAMMGGTLRNVLRNYYPPSAIPANK